MNNSPLNIFLILFLFERYHQNCQSALATVGMNGLRFSDHIRTLDVNGLTLKLLVANFANTKCCKNTEKLLKPCHIGTHRRVLSKSYPMNTNITGLRCFFRNLLPLVLWMKVATAQKGFIKKRGSLLISPCHSHQEA